MKPDGNAFVARVIEHARRLSVTQPLSDYMRGYCIAEINVARHYFGATDGVCDLGIDVVRELSRNSTKVTA